MSGPIICSKFDPSHSYLALAVQALDTHQVKVQAVVLAQDSLNVSFNLKKGAKLATLEWISSDLIALCQTNGTILIYSPSSNSIVAELESPVNLEITDFYFCKFSQSGWSADINGNIYEWDLQNYLLVQRFALSDMLDGTEHISKLATVMYEKEIHLLVGTHNVYMVNLLSKSIVQTFPAHVQPLITLMPVPNKKDLFITAAEGDRFANVFSMQKGAPLAVLVAQSNIKQVAFGVHKSKNNTMLAVIVENGSLEIFNNPLTTVSPNDDSTPKKKRKQMLSKSRHCDASLKFSRPSDEIRTPEDENLYINAIAASKTVLHVTWNENGAMARFDALPWFAEDYVFTGHKVITEAKQSITTHSNTKGSQDVAAARLYNEDHTVVTEGSAFQDDLEEEDEDEDESLAERLEKLGGDSKKKQSGAKKLSKHTAGTLTMVLSQALRNNDHSLLETVLSNRDPMVVQNTISRLNSSLAVVLLDRLTERITRQQLRFDQLNYWLKWIIIIHGGMLSSMPNMKSKLSSLHAILTKKANTLPRLLELQGRLNMLELQNALKKEILAGSAAQNDYDDADTDVEYVEEIDDAVESGLVESDDDIEMNGLDVADDYEESDEEIVEEDDGLSDVETAVEHHDVFE